jgi:hypothetical protein
MENNQPEPGGFRAGIERGPDGESTGNIICYPSFDPNCKVVTTPKPNSIDSTGFLSLPEPTPFHDETLIKATAAINGVLEKVLSSNEPRKGNLHVIMLDDGPMLAWVRAEAMPINDIRKPMMTHHS